MSKVFLFVICIIIIIALIIFPLIVYTVGKENGYEKNLRDWFKLIYEVVFGEENGPRLGFFISFFGLNETIELIKDKLK